MLDADAILQRVLAKRLDDEIEDPEPGIEFVTLRDLCATPDPPCEELLGPLVIRGQRLVIGAATGAGKTTFVMWMLKAMVEGVDFLGWQGTGDCRVVVIDAEQALPDIKRLAHETGLTECVDIHYVHAPDGLTIASGNHAAVEIEAGIRDIMPHLVVMDPLYKLHLGDSNAERDAVDLMRVFDRWRVTYDFGLILPVHCRKEPSGGKDTFTMNEVFGSTAWLRGAEVVIGLQLLADGKSMLHFWKSRSGGLPVRTKWPLTFSRSRGFRRDTVTSDDEVADDVLRALRAAGPEGATMYELQQATQHNRSQVLAALKRQNIEGRFAGGRSKRWSIPVINDEDALRWGVD